MDNTGQNAAPKRPTFICARDICEGDTLCYTAPPHHVVVQSISAGKNPISVGLHANDDTWTAFYDPACRLRVIRGAQGQAADKARQQPASTDPLGESEAAAIAADLAYQNLKDTGEIWRMEERRAIELDRQWGVA